MDKNVEIGLLLDIYGEILTDKQQNVLDLYYTKTRKADTKDTFRIIKDPN